MPRTGCQRTDHPSFARRTALQIGSVGLLGLGMNHVAGLRSLAADNGVAAVTPQAKAVIYVFLSGGLGQHDSFDMKPDAPLDIRGEFSPIATRTPGISICEHLPLLAARSDQWALVRSLTHPYNEHSLGHHVMLTGRTPVPPGFSDSKPKPTDFPSIATNPLNSPRSVLRTIRPLSRSQILIVIRRRWGPSAAYQPSQGSQLADLWIANPTAASFRRSQCPNGRHGFVSSYENAGGSVRRCHWSLPVENLASEPERSPAKHLSKDETLEARQQ